MDYDNRVYFNYNKDFKKIGYKSHNMALKGIKELIIHQIIACDVRENHYWLNPAVVCKGERFSKFIQYEVGTPTLFDDKTDKKLTEMNKKATS